VYREDEKRALVLVEHPVGVFRCVVVTRCVSTARSWRFSPLLFWQLPAVFNLLTPTVAIWVTWYILCQTGLSRHFVIFDIPAFWRSALSVRVPGCQSSVWRQYRQLLACSLSLIFKNTTDMSLLRLNPAMLAYPLSTPGTPTREWSRPRQPHSTRQFTHLKLVFHRCIVSSTAEMSCKWSGRIRRTLANRSRSANEYNRKMIAYVRRIGPAKRCRICSSRIVLKFMLIWACQCL